MLAAAIDSSSKNALSRRRQTEKYLQNCSGAPRVSSSQQSTCSALQHSKSKSHRCQTMALDMFDGMVKRSFSDFTGLQLTALQWKQAALGLAHGGLGLRSTSDHAAAAFFTSWAILNAVRELDASLSLPEARAADVLGALTAFNAQGGMSSWPSHSSLRSIHERARLLECRACCKKSSLC